MGDKYTGKEKKFAVDRLIDASYTGKKCGLMNNVFDVDYYCFVKSMPMPVMDIRAAKDPQRMT